jgi:hypothetical protein
MWSEGLSVPWAPGDARDATEEPCTQVPFVVQSGRTLFMVEATDDGWTLAELDFQIGECTFREARRATYPWPREAFGVMLSRIAGAAPDEAEIARLTDDFQTWLGDRFSRRRCDRAVSC